MMKNRLKCFKCGKVKDIDHKNAAKVIECEHCHSKMCIDY